MDASTVAALREFLGRDYVIEAAAEAEYIADQDPKYLIAWPHTLSFVSKAYRDRARAAFAAVIDLASADDYDSGAGWNRVADAMDRHGAAKVLADPSLVDDFSEPADRDCHAPVKDSEQHDTFPVGRQVGS